MTEFSDCGEIAKVALEFQKKYYQMLDDPAQRHGVLEFYSAGVPDVCEWNGHKLPTSEHVSSYINTLPKTKHKIDCLDAQPLPGNEGGDSFLATVHGSVTYDDEHEREFFQRLVIRRVEGRYYIINDYYRWLGEAE